VVGFFDRVDQMYSNIKHDRRTKNTHYNLQNLSSKVKFLQRFRLAPDDEGRRVFGYTFKLFVCAKKMTTYYRYQAIFVSLSIFVPVFG